MDECQNTLFNILNDQQKSAVYPKNGILLVLAGAGSGKTRVITYRIINLILNHEVEAENIVALTFTNKAALEMKERVITFFNSNSFNKDISKLYVGTFHSYCLKLLKTYGPQFLRLDKFNIIDGVDQEKIVRSIINEKNLAKRITIKQALNFISNLKNDPTLDIKKLNNGINLGINNIILDIYINYEKRKEESLCLDFDDILLYALKLFKNNEFKIYFKNRIKHLLIDEYQDTNKIQNMLLKSISYIDNNNFNLDSLCAVGDEDQSIYSWRGANVYNIMNFKSDFPNTKLIVIDQNYRSVQPILSIANSLINNNISRNKKNLWSLKKAKDRIRLISCSSSNQESEIIAIILKNDIKNINNYAILYRSHFQSRNIEEALIRHSIPYKIISGIQFYDRLEIKDILAYLRLMSNSYDRISFSRIINVPTRSLGNKFESNIYDLWNMNESLDFKDILDLALSKIKLTNIQKKAIENFISIFDIDINSKKPSKIIEHIIQNIDYYNYLQKEYDATEFNIKKENIKEFINSCIYFENNNNENSLNDFLINISLFQENLSNLDDNGVKLMTLHSAKGLEFDNIIISGLEESILPSTHSIYDNNLLEEERRLLYVGITRAKERLIMTYSSTRYSFGNITDQIPSRFIKELSKDDLQFEDFSNSALYEISNYFKNWINTNKY